MGESRASRNLLRTGDPADALKGESYSPKAAAAGKDIGKPGKNFKKIVAKNGGGAKGKRIAGAVLRDLRKKKGY